MRLLITGASGLFGSKIAQLAAKDYEVYSGYSKDKPIYGTAVQFDITNKKTGRTRFPKGESRCLGTCCHINGC